MATHHHHPHHHCYTCEGRLEEKAAAASTQPKTEHNRVGVVVMDPAQLWSCLTEDEMQARSREEDVTPIVTNQEGKIGAAFIEITDVPIDTNRLFTKLAMGSEACGALSTFLGTTRDNFRGRKVKRLEYECYFTMAMVQMRKIVGEIFATFPQVHRVVISHRVGLVPVTEPSVLIAVATEHRRSGIEAAAFAIDTLKAKVPIWKDEIYADGDVDGDGGHQWKANPEFADMVAGLAKGTEKGV